MIVSVIGVLFCLAAVDGAVDKSKGGVASSLSVNLPIWALEQRFRNGGFLTRLNETKLVRSPEPLKELHSAQQYTEESHAVSQYFYGMRRGFYFELGGLDGFRFSNTIGLSADLKWRGALLEGSPANFQKLVVNRPQQIGINAVVCKEVQTVHYLDEKSGYSTDYGPVFGIWEFMSPEFRARWYPKMKAPPKSSQVACVPLGYVFQYLGIEHINFLSLDIEGNELGALESIDFDRITFDVMCIEGHKPEVRALLESKGYVFSEELESNDWFIRKGFVKSSIPDGSKLKVSKLTKSPFVA
jgi:hypothetical protein